MKPMQFGMMKLTRIPYSDLERDIREAEAMGFDSAWIDDDLFSPPMRNWMSGPCWVGWRLPPSGFGWARWSPCRPFGCLR